MAVKRRNFSPAFKAKVALAEIREEAKLKAGHHWMLKWWSGGESNSRPSHCERDALPTELPPHAEGKFYHRRRRRIIRPARAWITLHCRT